MRGLVYVATVLAALSANARADDFDGDDEAKLRARFTGLEGGIGIPVGDMPYGDYSGGAAGLTVDAGHRWNRLLAFAEYHFLAEHGRIGEEQRVRRAYLHRWSANLRYDLLQDRVEGVLPVSLFVEAGAGEELLRWADGGELVRPDVGVAIGAQILVPAHHRGYWGFHARLQMLVAQAPQMSDASPRCGGPCYAPSSPMRTDLGVLFSMGFPFGK